MKLLTAAQMREVDSRTIEAGMSHGILMENAGRRFVEYLLENNRPLKGGRYVVLCGKGNNGGDGFVIARQLLTRLHPPVVQVVATELDETSAPLRMLRLTGCPIFTEIEPPMHAADVVIDAILGTGLVGPARGRALDFIRTINTGFPDAKVIAVDIPSGMNSDSGSSEGEIARADICITFTAPKLAQAFAPNCDHVRDWIVASIGTPASFLEEINLDLNGPDAFTHILGSRPKESNKGTYGHVLVVGGAAGKTGAAAMSGLAALRTGAGLVTVACSADNLTAPELMRTHLPADVIELETMSERMNVIAIGPGLGTDPGHVKLVREAVVKCSKPMVVDADALNALAGFEWNASGNFRVLTPHPGEMARLMGTSVPQVQADRLHSARTLAQRTGAVVVLKGHRTVIAFPDGRASINPTGSPAMATAGSGDVLTGITAGLLAQFPNHPEEAVLAAVYVHGIAGSHNQGFGYTPLIATDIINYLPEAIRARPNVTNQI